MVRAIRIGEHAFEKKGAAEEFLKAILYKYDIGDLVDAKDSEILSELLHRHPEALLKIGPGIESFHVRKADFGTRCFYVTRVDGTEEKFSARSCL
ncbi:DCL family protein [Rhizobium acaciae]|uniref:DCL family protein n=1 Tax=Rhizobium acaciae TaxID=2989736 RepID=UPI00221F62DB|nr:DCL family protein [Rhizobium acaciae]MCW1750837.1 DCL family protein [Rhizobium acaciae]